MLRSAGEARERAERRLTRVSLVYCSPADGVRRFWLLMADGDME